MLLHNVVLFSAMQASMPPALTAQEIAERMLVADEARLAALAGYAGARRYRFENKGFNKRAEVAVRLTCDRTGLKTFDITSENGSGFVRRRIIRKMIEAEAEASQKGERQDTRITPRNYDFRLVGREATDGREAYVLEVVPKKPNKFLIVGRIWVDCEDFAIARIEGSPAKNPSFWIRRVHIVQRYGREGRFWFPVRNESRAEARVFGATEVIIEFFDYSIESPDEERAITAELAPSGR